MMIPEGSYEGEDLALLSAVGRMLQVRKVSAQDIYDWKASRGNIGFWPRRMREQWLAWALKVTGGAK